MLIDEKKLIIPEPTVLNTCAIVVLFYPDTEFNARLSALLTQFSFIVLVDNTPNGAYLGDMPKAVHVLHNGLNLGIAAALNKGTDIAIDRGYEWIATFDQDSDVFPDYLKNTLTIAAIRTPKPVLVGSNYVNDESSIAAHRPPKKTTDAWVRSTLITSGTLMSARFAKNIGGFREDYFIDSVDHEFCLRAHRHGAEILMTVQPLMRHRMGKSSIGLFGLIFSRQHAPIRRYYLARNTILTIREHGVQFPLWTLRQIFRLLGEGFSIAFLESEKCLKIRAFMRGLWHGLIGRSGSIEST